MKTLYRRLTALLLAAAVLFTLTGPAAAAKAPAWDAEITQKNILKLVEAYNSDVYDYLSAMDEHGDNFLQWYMGAQNIVDRIDTCVHEEYHGYTFEMGGFDSNTWSNREAFYVGGGKTWYVTPTDTFETNLATSGIPEELRTFRYDTYVGPGAGVTANQNGAYGLLDEFAAYYWGMNMVESLYPYIKENVSSVYDWQPFISSYANNRNAYAEFYYWTLVYLKYAKKNYPAIYKQIIGNKKYAKTFVRMEKRFRKLMKAYEKDLDEVCMTYSGASFSDCYRDGYVWLGNWGTGTQDNYSVLIKEIKSKKYKTVRNALLNAGK